MPQQTNLNVSPYFDDFDSNNNYYRVLFKPGYPVQARELTTLQSILQNQIEKFGQHFFKEGSRVIPGNTGYNQLYYCVQLNNTYQGVPVSAYVDQILGSKITGQTSGVTAYVDSILFPENSENGNLTLYINYLSSSTQNNSTQQFLDGESITSDTTISSGLLGNTVIEQGSPFAITISNGAAATGSSFQIQDGVYFIRGQFVEVQKETLILDQYSSNPSYRVGLFITEEIINSNIDENLNDNSQGFNNYSAPGADRLKISTRLFKKPLNDFNDDNFIELATISDGILRSQKKQTSNTSGGGNSNGVFYGDLTDVLARRTYAESGDYYVKPFDITPLESLNDKLGNRGLYNAGQFTPGGSTPSEDLALYKISPGKAFVRGYELESLSPTFLDVEKPRNTKTIENQSIIYNTGSTLKLNRVYGSPVIGIGNTYVLSLRDSRVGISSTTSPGKEIGVSRVYDFRLESGSYSSSDDKLNQWNISLFDIQTNTDITVNEPVSLSVPTFVKGSNSGATGFLRYSVSSGIAVTVYETEGEFIPNESLIFDGIQDGRIAVAVTSHKISDVKSVYGTVGSASTFSADIIQSTSFNVGVATISEFSGGISTVRSTNSLFPGSVVKENNLVQYTDLSSSDDPIVAKVTSVENNSITIVGVATVSGIANGKLPNSTLNVTDFKILTTKLDESTDDTLYTRLPKPNIQSVDLTDASLSIRKVFTVNISSNQLATPVDAGTNETFLAFDPERYSLIRSDGTTEELTSDKFSFLSGGSQLQIYNLGSNDTGATLVTTLRKIKPKSKEKIKNRVNSIVIDKSKYQGSGIGATTLNDGLTYGNYPFGTRVQDEIISINTPDIVELHGIFESSDTSTPTSPRVTLSSINSISTTTDEFIIGELLVGQTSDAVAICVEKVSDSQIGFIYKNENQFKEGETIISQESNIQSTISALSSLSFDISSNFTYSNGQEGSFYDYGSIKRKADSSEPSKKLVIYFSNGYYDSSDDGDITTINSYNQFSYSKDIQLINGVSTSDIIDIRPRVSTYTTSEGQRSPLEFLGRTFNQNGNSSANILASDESILTTFSFYLGRIDRIFLTKDGKFQIKYGTPAEKPEKPVSVDDALEIATVNLPPYLYNVTQASIQFLEHKRYRMVDIKQLENRIKNLEYYTALSLLETNTANLFIPDSDGLNRFKSGFFVDNFSSFQAQEDKIDIKNSLDRKNKEIRPKHYTNSIDLIFGPVVNTNPTADLSFSTIEGNNVRKSNDVVTLDYAEVEWLKQTFATRTESVTPFMISFWQGTLELTPSSDTWVDTARLNAKVIDVEGNYAETVNKLADSGKIDPQTGFGSVIWDSWETNWTGTEVITTNKTRTQTSGPAYRGWVGHSGGRGRIPAYGTRVTQTIQDTFKETVQTGVESRTGVRTFVTEEYEKISQGDRVVSRDLIPVMRSRNVEFVSKRVKPLTQFYAFFDGVDVTKYCVPKLLEINMISGTFEVGETVVGSVISTGLGPNLINTSPKITFRAAQSNHREGPYNTPTKIFPNNPYNNQVLQASYSSTSKILNVDTTSLSDQAQGKYYGYVETGMVLVGQTSGAKATITNVRLISDLTATLIGNFFIPDPNNINHPRFESGVKVFTLVNDDQNNQDVATSLAEESYSSSGTLETVQENIISVRNARVEQKQEFQSKIVSKSLGTQLSGSSVIGERRENVVIGWYDPLAQSFLVEDETGVFLTKCDVYFQSKDDMDVPVVFQLRTMENGYPTQRVLPFSEIVLDPDDIIVSSDGSVGTSFEFKAPVYVEGGKEYAMCLASNSTKYSVFVSRVGENDIISGTFISNQPYLGSLFKSQNASTWEASQWEDLKFVLYRADFLESGSVDFYNPELSEGNGQVPTLLPNPITFYSRKLRLGLSTSISDSGYVLGNTFSQLGTNATGNLVGTAGTAVGNLSISNAGIGYTPSSSAFTFSNVNLVTITGNGRGATANVTINNGVAIAATISSGGSGYQIGDTLGISTIGSNSIGRNARLSIVSIGSTQELVLDNVQGDFVVGSANTISYTNSSGITTELNYSVGGNVQVSSIIVDSDGLHAKVNHQNHGMYFSNNLVKISGVYSDIKPTKLSVAYDSASTGGISVDDASQFENFENVGVGTTNTGYLLIGNEVIEYTSVSGNTIGGNIVRGTNPVSYEIGTPVYKYELNGVSLKRINKTHDLSDVTVDNPITFDSYHIKIDMSSDGKDRSTGIGYPKLYLDQTKSSGGYNIKATQNMPFEAITPVVQNLTVAGTNVSGQIRTVTGKSLSGNEIPFVDNGFENISLNQTNYLDSPRLICSKVNEDANLTNLAGNKSMNMRIFLNTLDTRVSPVIDNQRISTILTSNRVNSVIENYSTDSRVNTLDNDPSACQYISKEIFLENPATSLKILVNAHINLDSDIRAFYAISANPGFNPVFIPFPGWSNLDSNGEIITPENNDGQSDKFITKSNSYGFESETIEFKEYTFTADQLPAFKAYRVKIVLTSTSQVYVPRAKDLRVIALA